LLTKHTKGAGDRLTAHTNIVKAKPSQYLSKRDVGLPVLVTGFPGMNGYVVFVEKHGGS